MVIITIRDLNTFSQEIDVPLGIHVSTLKQQALVQYRINLVNYRSYSNGKEINDQTTISEEVLGIYKTIFFLHNQTPISHFSSRFNSRTSYQFVKHQRHFVREPCFCDERHQLQANLHRFANILDHAIHRLGNFRNMHQPLPPPPPMNNAIDSNENEFVDEDVDNFQNPFLQQMRFVQDNTDAPQPLLGRMDSSSDDNVDMEPRDLIQIVTDSTPFPFGLFFQPRNHFPLPPPPPPPPPAQHELQLFQANLPEEEEQAIQRLVLLSGFDRLTVLQVYEACAHNEADTQQCLTTMR